MYVGCEECCDAGTWNPCPGNTKKYVGSMKWSTDKICAMNTPSRDKAKLEMKDLGLGDVFTVNGYTNNKGQPVHFMFVSRDVVSEWQYNGKSRILDKFAVGGTTYYVTAYNAVVATRLDIKLYKEGSQKFYSNHKVTKTGNADITVKYL